MELIHPDAQLPAAAENRAQRHDRRGRTGQRQGAGRGRPPLHRSPRPNRTPTSTPFLATLDADTRQYIQLLVAGGAQGIGGRGKQSRQRAAPLRALRPLHREAEQSDRRPAHRAGAGDPQLRRTDRPNSAATTPQIRRFVTSSEAALGNFANQQEAIQEALRRVPGDPAGRQSRPRQLERILRQSRSRR